MITCQWRLDYDDKCQTFVAACAGNQYPPVRGSLECYLLVKDEKPCHFCGNPLEVGETLLEYARQIVEEGRFVGGLDKTR